MRENILHNWPRLKLSTRLPTETSALRGCVDNLFHEVCVSQFPLVVHLSANWERWRDDSLLN